MTLNKSFPVIDPPPTHFTHLILGTDLVFVPRLAKTYARQGDAFFHRVLTPEEVRYCKGMGLFREAVFLKRAAGRIAIKEAVAKALGCGLNGMGWGQGIGWLDVEIVSQTQSPPELVLQGRALKIAAGLGIRSWRLSLSHDGEYALATVIGLA